MIPNRVINVPSTLVAATQMTTRIALRHVQMDGWLFDDDSL